MAIKVYTSYFYQVRNMRPGCLAFSTAVFDPKWFKGNGSPWIDKNGVLNGLRAEPFVPYFNEQPQEDACRGPEGCKYIDLPWHCPFLEGYQKQINLLSPSDIEQRFLKVGEKWREKLNDPTLPLTFILLVHEAPSNPCSERVVLQQWLRENNMCGKEWTPNV